MDIKSKLSMQLSTADAAELVAQAISQQLSEKIGVKFLPKDLVVRFNTTMEYDQMDRGPGFPVFSGIDIEVKQDVSRRSRSSNSIASQIESVENQGRWFDR